MAADAAGSLATPLRGSSGSTADEPARIAAFYGDNSGVVLGANWIYLLAGALMIVFAGALRSILNRAEGGDGLLSGLAFGGILAGAAATLAGTALDTAAALRVDEQGAIAPDIAAVMADGHGVLFGLAAPMAFSVGVLATAALALRTSVLPTWLAGLKRRARHRPARGADRLHRGDRLLLLVSGDRPRAVPPVAHRGVTRRGVAQPGSRGASRAARPARGAACRQERPALGDERRSGAGQNLSDPNAGESAVSQSGSR